MVRLLWGENQALLAFSGGTDEDDTVKKAKYIIKRLKTSGSKIMTKRELKHLCRAIHDDSIFDEAIELLEDMKYMRSKLVETSGRSSVRCYINPFI